MPSDLEQATGLERLEILGKMQGVDIFDMKPLDASRKGASSTRIPGPFRVSCVPHPLFPPLHVDFMSGLAKYIRLGTLDNPIIVKSFGDEQYAGCTGYPADSHVTIWLTVRSPAPRAGRRM